MLERATSRTVRRQEFCEPPDKENHVPSSSGTSDSADRSAAWPTFPADDSHRELVAGDMGAKFVSLSSRGGLIPCWLVLGVLRVRSPAFQIQ